MSDQRTKTGHSVNLVQRCAEALDLQPLELAHLLDTTYEDVIGVWTGKRSSLIAVDMDETLLKLVSHVNDRIAKLLGVREELQRKIDIDRRERAEQRRRTLER